MISPVATLLLLLSMVGSQRITAAATADNNSSTTQTIVVAVGKADHKFDPDTLYANPGDTIRFEFYPTNHSVVRSSFSYPCIPYEMTTPNVDGFFSGFRPVMTLQKDPPYFSVLINDTHPIYFYCSAPGSCNGRGMVGIINPPNSSSPSVVQTYANFQEKALQAGYVISPGEGWPNEADIPSTDTTTTTTEHRSKKMSAGTAAGIAIGVIAAAVLGAVVLALCFIRRKQRRARSSGLNIGNDGVKDGTKDSASKASSLGGGIIGMHTGNDNTYAGGYDYMNLAQLQQQLNPPWASTSATVPTNANYFPGLSSPAVPMPLSPWSGLLPRQSETARTEPVELDAPPVGIPAGGGGDGASSTKSERRSRNFSRPSSGPPSNISTKHATGMEFI